MFKNLRVSWKLGLGFCTVVCITLALGGYGWNAFRQVGKATDLVTDATAASESVGQLRKQRMDFSLHGFKLADGETKNHCRTVGRRNPGAEQPAGTASKQAWSEREAVRTP